MSLKMMYPGAETFLQEVKDAALNTSPEAHEALAGRLKYLDEYGGDRADVMIGRDTCAPYSFALTCVGTKRLPDGRDDIWWIGGLIYSGPGLQGGAKVVLNGGAPSFTVSLTPTGDEHSWSVHT